MNYILVKIAFVVLYYMMYCKHKFFINKIHMKNQSISPEIVELLQKISPEILSLYRIVGISPEIVNLSLTLLQGIRQETLDLSLEHSQTLLDDIATLEEYFKNGGESLEELTHLLCGGQINAELHKLNLAVDIAKAKGLHVDYNTVIIIGSLIKSGMTSTDAKATFNNLKLDENAKQSFVNFIKDNEAILENINSILQNLNDVFKSGMQVNDYKVILNFLVDTYKQITNSPKNIADLVMYNNIPLEDAIECNTIDCSELDKLETKLKTIKELTGNGMNYDEALAIYNDSIQEETNYVHFVKKQSQSEEVKKAL